MKTKKERVTIRDVAHRARVGVGTVSRVLSGSPQVSETTRSRVLSSIEDLNFQPSRVAGALASRRTRLVAVLVPTLGHSIFSETVDGISEVLGADEIQIMLGYTNYSDDRETVLVESFLRHWPEAFILVGTARSAQTRTLLERARIPVVETWELPAEPIDMVVGFDNRDAARSITQALIEQGYGSIALMARSAGIDNRNDLRVAGYQDAMGAAGLETRFVRLADSANQSIGAGCHALQTMLAERIHSDALLCCDDIHAVGALFECQRRGLSVPHDLAIAGFGDFPLAREVHPRLTTVRVPGHEIGRQAAGLLLRRLAEGGAVEPPRNLGFAIVRRESA